MYHLAIPPHLFPHEHHVAQVLDPALQSDLGPGLHLISPLLRLDPGLRHRRAGLSEPGG